MISREHELTWVIFAFALVRDILRPAPCEQELHDWAFPLPLVTKLPVPAHIPLPDTAHLHTRPSTRYSNGTLEDENFQVSGRPWMVSWIETIEQHHPLTQAGGRQ